jgi:threonine/homoserine/homoserine lactone efflux protein
MAGMARTLWIVGLTIVLVQLGGFTALCVFGLVTRHHLNSKGWLMLAGSAYIFWITLQYLRMKIAEGHKSATEKSN